MRVVKIGVFKKQLHYCNGTRIAILTDVVYQFPRILLSLIIAILAMSFSSVSVIGNALRLRTVKLN